MKQLLLAAALLTAPTIAFAQGESINLGYNGPPDAEKNAVHFFASNLERLVEDRSDIEIELYPNSQLGSEQERMENTLATPSLNIASFAGLSPIVPEVFVANTPFLFDDVEQARSFFDNSEYWKMVQNAFSERTGGSRILEVVEEGGFLAFTSTDTPIDEPADFEGLTFRAMDPSQVALYEAMGASGTPVPWTEVYSALQTGVADGQMNPPMYIIIGSLYEVQKYMTDAKVQYSMQFLVGNGQWLDSLSDEDRQMLSEAVSEANAMTREEVQSNVERRVEFLRDEGMEIIQPSDEQMAAFQRQGQPGYIEWLKTQSIDPGFIETAFEDVGKSDLLK